MNDADSDFALQNDASKLILSLAEEYGDRLTIMGISESATAHAIEALPPEVTLSFAPYGSNLQQWIDK